MDNELFALCKEVFKSFPAWNDTKDVYGERKRFGVTVDTDIYSRSEMENADGFAINELCPFYTSDYLLEKLPENIKDGSDYIWAWLSMDNLGEDGWQFGYRKGAATPLFKAIADTPLKALLKLTLALKKAGEL